MYVEDAYSRKGEKSGYLPPPEVVALTRQVQMDYSYGHSLLTRTWMELNQRSVIDDENRGQLMFNAFVDTSVEDPNEAWKWRGTRSQARNKGIAMHANLTQNFLLPLFVAQNDDDETDQEFAEVMRDIIEWMAEPTNSSYQESFLQVVFGMMSSPVTYLGAEFAEVYQTIRERQQDGTISKKQILDTVLSGFQAPVYGPSEILITNAYERNIQKQRAIIKRRYVEKSELEGKYGTHPNWQYVRAGWRTVYNAKDGLFYDYFDFQHPLLVEEVTWLNRRQDTEACFLGGIYLGAESVGDNPIYHRDNRGAPKYNVIPFGYSRIGDHFFYFKSMMSVVGWDHMLVDAMTELVMNRTILEVDQPVGIYGVDKDNFDGDIVFPKAVVAFENPESKVVPILPKSDLGAGYNAIAASEKSMSDSSIDPISSGQMPGGRQQAYVIATVQANAKKIIAEVAKSLAVSLAQYGDLMKDIAINHLVVPQIEELTAGALRLKYRGFLLPNKQVGGRTVHKKIQFDASLIGTEMADEEKTIEALKLLESSGWPDENHALMRINPELFAKFTYLAKTDIEELFAHNNEFWQPILTHLYTMLAQDPLADQEWLLRKLGRSYFNAEGEKLVKKQPTQNPMALQTPPQEKPAAAPEPSGGGRPLRPGTPGGAYAKSLPAPGNNSPGAMAQVSALSTSLPMQGR